MKLKYFRIKNELYFTVLIAIHKMQHDSDFFKRMNVSAELYCMHNKYSLKCKVMTEDYLFKMIKCCGNSIFNREDKFYFVKPHDFLPVYLTFRNLVMLSANTDEILQTIKGFIIEQLNEYGHYTFDEYMTICNSIPAFKLEISKVDKSLVQFLSNYYSLELPKEDKFFKKKKIIIKRQKK